MNFRFPRFTLLAALFAAGAQPVAEAAEYADVNTTASTISFTYDQMGASVYGTFSRFEGSLYFDTVRPESAACQVDHRARQHRCRQQRRQQRIEENRLVRYGGLSAGDF